VDADGKTGDGAGIHIEIPQDFFAEVVERGGDRLRPGRIAVGMVFMPKTDLGAQERCRQIVETEILNAGYNIYGWRQVPIDVSCIGEKANATRPEIEQILIWDPEQRDAATCERDMYVIRRRIEKQAIMAQVPELYLCSLSGRSVIYKGMFLAENLTDFYPDLKDERFVSRFAIYHQRYSTNTFPTWRLAQPFRMLAHNGEINTVHGNVNWMKSHETRLSHPLLDPFMEDIKPVVQAGGSDTATLDNVFELLVRAGRDAPMAKAMLIPESIGSNSTMPQAHRDLFLYCNAVMEPWDGPAAIAATDGRWAVAGLDRNGLRPMRYTITADKLLIVGSETGMVKVREDEVLAKGALARGRASPSISIPRPSTTRPRSRTCLPPASPLAIGCSAPPRSTASSATRWMRPSCWAPRRCAAGSSPWASPWRIWRPSCTRWWRKGRKPSARWATTRPSLCCRSIIVGCPISSARCSRR